MERCNEIVARTPTVLLERSLVPNDYTHLQYCGAPVVASGKCARHLARPNTRLAAMWRRFMRRTR